MEFKRIPRWFIAVNREDAEAVTATVRALLQDLPMSHEELADRIGVAQSTVSRWAGGTDPALDRYIAVVDAVAGRLAELQVRVERARKLLKAVEEAVEADDHYLETGDKDDLKKTQAARKHVSELVAQDDT